MWKAALAGAVALATVGSLSVTPQGIEVGEAVAQELELTQAQLAQLKSVLHLRPTQEPHWRIVEATLRGYAHQAPYQVADAGTTHARAKPVSYRLDFMAMQQVASAARPLIDSLDETQKRDGTVAMRAMGVPPLF
jgi:hypothetical protein